MYLLHARLRLPEDGWAYGAYPRVCHENGLVCSMAATATSDTPCSCLCAQSLHYGIGCFEGMKAYAGSEDGLGRLFRPDMNMARLQRSSQRLMLADFDAQVDICTRTLNPDKSSPT